jgi:protoheme IX farnesyltransferase
LVAASASALNQWLEQDADARMVRTASRPLPAGRLRRLEVVVIAAAWVIAGTAILWFLTQPIAAAIAGASWFVYVAVYTPLKRVAPCNTAVGAVAGALPVLIGWTAVGGQIGVPALAVTTIVFLWQFPHFMAIAWLHRRQYATVGMQMLPVVDRSGIAAGRVAVAGALALLPMCLVPALVPWASNVAVYGFWAIVLGLGQFTCAAAFLLRRDDVSARWLLRASLVYLPCVFGLLLLTV